MGPASSHLSSPLHLPPLYPAYLLHSVWCIIIYLLLLCAFGVCGRDSGQGMAAGRHGRRHGQAWQGKQQWRGMGSVAWQQQHGRHGQAWAWPGSSNFGIYSLLHDMGMRQKMGHEKQEKGKRRFENGMAGMAGILAFCRHGVVARQAGRQATSMAWHGMDRAWQLAWQQQHGWLKSMAWLGRHGSWGLAFCCMPLTCTPAYLLWDCNHIAS